MNHALTPSQNEAVNGHDIEIFRGEKVWLARFPGNAALNHLFGTDTLPTAWMPQVPACEVKARLQQLNPGARIVFLEEVSEP